MCHHICLQSGWQAHLMCRYMLVWPFYQWSQKLVSITAAKSDRCWKNKQSGIDTIICGIVFYLKKVVVIKDITVHHCEALTIENKRQTWETRHWPPRMKQSAMAWWYFPSNTNQPAMVKKTFAIFKCDKVFKLQKENCPNFKPE